MANDLREFDEAIKKLERATRSIPTRAATVAVNFTRERFRQQNWLDDTAEPWKKRKAKKKPSRTDKRAVLVKSGRLMRSIRKISATTERAIIGTDVEYAEVHNNGGKFAGAVQVSSHTRKTHSRKREGRKREQVKAHTVKSHTRQVNFTMPQRQFIGNSAELNKQVQTLITNDITNALKK